MSSSSLPPPGERRWGSWARSSAVCSFAEVVFERVEQLKELVTDPFAITAAPNPRGREHACLLQAVQRGAGCSRRHAVAIGGRVALTTGCAGRPRMIFRATESVRGEPARTTSSARRASI